MSGEVIQRKQEQIRENERSAEQQRVFAEDADLQSASLLCIIEPY